MLSVNSDLIERTVPLMKKPRAIPPRVIVPLHTALEQKNMELPTTTAILRATLPARAPPNLYPYTSEFVGALRDPISSSSSSFFYLLCAILFVSRTFAITR